MFAALLLVWSVIMAVPPPEPPVPPLTQAEKKAEYEMVKVQEVLTPAQIKQRDIIPGWRPIPPKSDIERGAIEIIPGEPNPFLVRDSWVLEGRGLTSDELSMLGQASPSPPGFRLRYGVVSGYWYERLNADGDFDGLWLVVFSAGSNARAVILAGPRLLGPALHADFLPSMKSGGAALETLKANLEQRSKRISSGVPPDSR